MPVINRRYPLGRQDQAWGRPFRLNKRSWQSEGLMLWYPAMGSLGFNQLIDYSGTGQNLNNLVGTPTYTFDPEWGYGIVFDGSTYFYTTPISDRLHDLYHDITQVVVLTCPYIAASSEWEDFISIDFAGANQRIGLFDCIVNSISFRWRSNFFRR